MLLSSASPLTLSTPWAVNVDVTAALAVPAVAAKAPAASAAAAITFLEFMGSSLLWGNRLKHGTHRTAVLFPGTTNTTITVPPGHVYLAGDNRASSDDSRVWGALPVAQLLGRYVRTLKSARPLHARGSLFRLIVLDRDDVQ